MPKQIPPNANKPADLGVLIERLGPINNQWREGSQTQKALALWDMGEILISEVADPSDELLWNIQSRSYLTRMTLRRALIVRRGWSRRSDFEDLVRELISFSVFLEALPFLKGKRENIDDRTYRQVVSLLGNSDTQSSISYLKKLKAAKIGRLNPRGIAAVEIQEHVVSFQRAVCQIDTISFADIDMAPPELFLRLSQITMAIATEEPINSCDIVGFSVPDKLHPIAGSLQAVLQRGRGAISAFRKGIGSERLMQVADWLNSLRSPETLIEWQRRSRVKHSISIAG